MISLNAPFNKNEIENLKVGDIVEISGTIYTARDAAHKKLFELLLKKQPLPFDLTDAVIYYTGATPAKDGEIIGSCGPTTSSRMDSYTPLLLANGVRGLIGKGGRSKPVTDALKAYSAVYFVAIGGAGAYYKSTVEAMELVAFPELQSEAIYKLTIKNFKVVVATDTNGNCLF
ncbi:MAG: FumA C-terminus/TtdB family hydratase beta subunit [Clostridia bacterium]